MTGVLSHAKDGMGQRSIGSGEEPTLALAVAADEEEATIVGRHPQTTVVVDGQRHDALVIDDIARTQPVTHIREAQQRCGLNEHAFLHQAQPKVALAVKQYVAHLRRAQVHLIAIEPWPADHTRHRVILFYSSTVKAHKHIA